MVTAARATQAGTGESPVPCGPPLTRTPMSADEAAAVARRFKAVADPARLRLLSIIASHDGGEACACDLNEPVGLSQPTVSHHLKVLVESGLLRREQRGVWAFYSVVGERLDALADVLSTGDRGQQQDFR